MSESFAGITVHPGEPGALETMASSWLGMGAALEGAASRLRSMQAGMSSWQGPASVAFAGANLTASDGVSVNGQAFDYAAGATSRYAHALREAKHEARAAIRDARDATSRIERATGALGDARARGGAAAAAEAIAATEVMASSLLGPPSASAQADQALAQQRREQAEADAARAHLPRRRRSTTGCSGASCTGSRGQVGPSRTSPSTPPRASATSRSA